MWIYHAVFIRFAVVGVYREQQTMQPDNILCKNLYRIVRVFEVCVAKNAKWKKVLKLCIMLPT